MSMPTRSLKEFMEPVPVCNETAGLATVLKIFSFGNCDRLVVVDKNEFPVGVLRLRTLMPHIIIKNNLHKGNCLFTGIGFDLQQPLSHIDLPLIEPVTTIAGHFSPSQFWPQLQETLSEGTGREVALVDPDGKFLGMLDSLRLLKFLLTESPVKDTAESIAHPQHYPISEAIAKTNAPPEITSQELESAGIPTLNPQPLIIALKPLMELIEQLPLPLRLQTGDGLVVSQNLTWRTQIGDTDTIENAIVETPLIGVLQNTDAFSRNSDNEEPDRPSYSQAANYSAVDVNARKKTPLQSTVMLCGEGEIKAPSDEEETFAVPLEQTLPIAATENGQERVWEFVKIPLHQSRNLERGALNNQQTNLTQLWLVMAQDVTDQQLFAQELVAKNADLVQLNRFKDEFLACISHELKTPLTAVLGLSSLLKDQLVGGLNERQLRYAQLIHQNGRSLMTVVNDILDLTRIETRQMELTLELVNISAVCDRAYLQAQQLQQVKENGLEQSLPQTRYTFDIESGLETFVADELRLRQMLVHLLSNALKFTEAEGEIGLRVRRWDGWIAFNVWDTGIGIPDAKQHLIFQKFQQLENPLTRKFDGAGLGLVLTQRLARLHGGDVSFISKPGEGSQFTLLLPPNPPDNSAAVRSRELGESDTEGDEEMRRNPYPQSLSRSPSLVLIVEAVPQYIEQVSVQLADLGYQVAIARNGTEAIEKSRRLQPLAVLLNPLVPLLSGWDVLTILKSDPQTKDIPVLVTATQAEKATALKNRADGFLTTPVQQQALRQSLNLYRQQQRNNCDAVTILRLVPPWELTHSEDDDLLGSSSERAVKYRVLEADDLEQADLLARVWHPDVVLLDGGSLEDPLAYLHQFSECRSLASLPLVTLDRQTTQAANQVSGLSVFPCLTPERNQLTAALSQVIQVAAGMKCQPGILVADLTTLPDLCNASKEGQNQSNIIREKSKENLETLQAIPQEKSEEKSEIHPSSFILPPSQEWLQALIQYLQTAGFRSLLSRSWGEVCRQVEHQSVDLVLLHLGDVLPPQPALFEALTSLERMSGKPPILVLDHRENAEVVSGKAALQPNSSNDIEAALGAVATRILRQSPQSMPDLLDHINQLLSDREWAMEDL
ncbi:response regulator [Microcoleus sp. FACHB-831]|uniref:ATP-binding protein n=1 Tax=Microcoleus sp. FACHB-831 TaxID=2692827 RepID=UPI001687B5BA|nr:ATP-binding protein [Microcoleus sp. FACHB-831]MBD1920449.1 response regulator [Microcoleus sp. FACHB-831]